MRRVCHLCALAGVPAPLVARSHSRGQQNTARCHHGRSTVYRWSSDFPQNSHWHSVGPDKCVCISSPEYLPVLQGARQAAPKRPPQERRAAAVAKKRAAEERTAERRAAKAMDDQTVASALKEQELGGNLIGVEATPSLSQPFGTFRRQGSHLLPDMALLSMCLLRV